MTVLFRLIAADLLTGSGVELDGISRQRSISIQPLTGAPLRLETLRIVERHFIPPSTVYKVEKIMTFVGIRLAPKGECAGPNVGLEPKDKAEGFRDDTGHRPQRECKPQCGKPTRYPP